MSIATKDAEAHTIPQGMSHSPKSVMLGLIIMQQCSMYDGKAIADALIDSKRCEFPNTK